ncbi:hypothetical protein QM012_003406 [Aureobasidium pullulans]|uniref:Nuclear pore complex protein Nup85 n=1 Tax=Aureobasidium pullulans TaxID=5580 RepID=A0ABR0T9R4_AURPU
MLSRTVWIQSQVAENENALLAGDGCHHEEAKALDDYLSGLLNTQEAADKITSPVLREENPSSQLYRLWGLLADALVELPNDREKLLDLLAAIQSLPSTTFIDWFQLKDFWSMWADCHRLHLHGKAPWESGSWTPTRKTELCNHYQAIGTAEASMSVRGIGGIPVDWGYEVLNLVCSRRPGLEVLIFEVYAWLQVAGARLSNDLSPEEIECFSRPIPGTRSGLQQSVRCTMGEHWNVWKRELSELSGEQSTLSLESRNVAAKCLALM